VACTPGVVAPLRPHVLSSRPFCPLARVRSPRLQYTLPLGESSAHAAFHAPMHQLAVCTSNCSPPPPRPPSIWILRGTHHVPAPPSLRCRPTPPRARPRPSTVSASTVYAAHPRAHPGTPGRGINQAPPHLLPPRRHALLGTCAGGARVSGQCVGKHQYETRPQA
jgi:hypothetical protein